MHNWSCAHIKTAQYWRSRSLPVSWLPPAPACIGQWIHTSACRSALLCAATSEKIRVNSSSATRHQSAHWLQRKTETRSGGSKRRVNAKQNNHQKVQKRKKKKPNDKTKDYSSNITGPNKGSCTRNIFLNRTGIFFSRTDSSLFVLIYALNRETVWLCLIDERPSITWLRWIYPLGVEPWFVCSDFGWVLSVRTACWIELSVPKQYSMTDNSDCGNERHARFR